MQLKPAFSPPKKRLLIDGVLLLDKAIDLSSNSALIKAKRLLNAKKAGHTGTLDPFATGLLPLCFGEATKFAQDLLEADKAYETTLELGARSTTGDTEGEIFERCTPHICETQLSAVLAKFVGAIEQIPPMYSALKRDGKPMYEYARAGITLERNARSVVIHSLELISYSAPYLKLKVSCSKGTYIRVLGEDIGTALGCGAYLRALRRTAVGELQLENAVTLEQIEAVPEMQRSALLAPVDALLQKFSAIQLDIEHSQRFLYGQRLNLNHLNCCLPKTGRVRVYRSDDQQLLGTANLDHFGVLSPERLIAKPSQTVLVELPLSL